MTDEAAPMRRPVAAVRPLVAHADGRHAVVPQEVVTEEPLQLQVALPGADPEPLTVTMRTPGHDFELAAGFLLGEGVIDTRHDIATIRYCELPEVGPQQFNVVTVRLTRRADVASAARRTMTTASCGVCGTATLQQLEGRCPPVPTGPAVALSVVSALQAKLRQSQPLFDRTGGVHAAGLFTPDGELVAAREDVGRHNALDKLIGWALLSGHLPLAGQVVAVSGRLSYELVQKAAVAGAAVLCAVSAPSSLAVRTAEAVGMGLAAFVRDGRATIYACQERFDLSA